MSPASQSLVNNGTGGRRRVFTQLGEFPLGWERDAGAPIQDNFPKKVIRDETAHYLVCPILSGIVTQATGLDHLLTLHERIFGNDIDDLTGVLACATSYHVYHSLKFGNLPIIQKAIETGTFSHVRAFAISSAKAFLNDFDIMSNGGILSIGFSGLKEGPQPTWLSRQQLSPSCFCFSLSGR